MSDSLPIKRRRLSRHYRSVNPEEANLYPNECTDMAPPILSDPTSSNVIVLGRSRPLHSRKKTCTDTDVSNITKRWHRSFQKYIASRRTTPNDLNLHNHQFIPNNIATSVQQQKQHTTSFPPPQSTALYTASTSQKRTSMTLTSVDPLCMGSSVTGQTNISSYRTKATNKVTTTATATATATIKKRQPLTMNIPKRRRRQQQQGQRHNMLLRSTAARNILKLSSDDKCIKTWKHERINSLQLQNDLEPSLTPPPSYLPHNTPPISPALLSNS